jgi:hypothetical protein
VRAFLVIVILSASGPTLADVTGAQAIAACERAIMERAQAVTTRYRSGSFEQRVMKLKFGLTDAAGKRSRAECRVSKRDGIVTGLEISGS